MGSCSTELRRFALLSGVFTGRYARRQILEPEPDNARNDGLEGKMIGEQIEVRVALAGNACRDMFRFAGNARLARFECKGDGTARFAICKQQPVLLKRLRCGRYGRELGPGDGRFASRGQPHLCIEADAGERDSGGSDHFPGG